MIDRPGCCRIASLAAVVALFIVGGPARAETRYSYGDAVAAVNYFFDGYLTKDQAIRVLKNCSDPRCRAAINRIQGGAPGPAPRNRYSYGDAVTAVSYFFDGYLTKDQAIKVLDNCPDPRCVAAANQVGRGPTSPDRGASSGAASGTGAGVGSGAGTIRGARQFSYGETIAAVSYFFDGYLTKEQAVRVLESCPDPRCVAAAKQVRAGAPRGAPAKQYSYAETVAVVNLFFAGEVSKEEALRVLRNCADAKCKAAASGLQAQAPAAAAGTAYTWNEVKTAVDYYFNGHLTKKRVLEILASCSEPQCARAQDNLGGRTR